MFKATKPFKNFVTGHENEPSLRIGKKVPSNAVNLAYYYNPVATDSEKVLTADPPRQTIDHRIETDYITLLDQASGPNGEEPSADLFPAATFYTDEEGYQGRLARQNVRWYPEKHVDQKSIEKDTDHIVETKGDEPKIEEYADIDGYKGNMYLDTVTYDTYKTVDKTEVKKLKYTISGFELNYHDIFKSYLNQEDISNSSFNHVPNPITGETDCWPAVIEINPDRLYTPDSGSYSSNVNNTIANYVNGLTNNWDGNNEILVDSDEIISSSKPIGTLYFEKLEYEPVTYNKAPKNGSVSDPKEIVVKTDSFPWDVEVAGDGSSYTNKIPNFVDQKINGSSFNSTYTGNTYLGYTEIEDFISLINTGDNAAVITSLRKSIEDKSDIVIYIGQINFVVEDANIDMLVTPGSEVADEDYSGSEEDEDDDPNDDIFDDGKISEGEVNDQGDGTDDTNDAVSSYLYNLINTFMQNKCNSDSSLQEKVNDGQVTDSIKSSLIDEFYTGYANLISSVISIQSSTVNSIKQAISEVLNKWLEDNNILDKIRKGNFSFTEDGGIIFYDENNTDTTGDPNEDPDEDSPEASADTDPDIHSIDPVAEPSLCHFDITFKYKVSGKYEEGDLLYNIIAVYSGMNDTNGDYSVSRTVTTRRTEASSYVAHCHYSGLINKNWIDYDGIAYYMGPVTKGNSIGNQNVEEDDNELLMFPDKDGYLRQIVESFKNTVDDNGYPVKELEYRNYYRVEADTVYVTDVFKDNEACFYKYRLKRPIYDYRGPEENGYYSGDAVKIYTSSLKNLPDSYKHNLKLSVADYEEVKTYDINNNPVITNVPKCYYADLYTNFISSSTDTFKVVYNGFNNTGDNEVVRSGIEEDIYNIPCMTNGVDYSIKSVDSKMRINNIQILNYSPIEDTRKRITFSWYVSATDGIDTFYSKTRTSSILNKEYCIPYEYSQFEDRAMIISPKLNGDIYPCSPRDLCLKDQSEYQKEDDSYQPIIDDQDTNFIYSVQITEISYSGSVNIKCNPDGSGYITAETTLDTGFYDEDKANYTKKLNLENPYYTDGQYIYQGYKVKCIDSRNIKVKPPREDNLLDSWHPLIQFGHYSRIMDQYGSHTKVCYSMPEYDTQHYSTQYGRPYVDISKEKAVVLNPHMIKTKCYPLHIRFTDLRTYENLFVYKEIDGQLFMLTVTNASFTDGVIIIKEAISENDSIVVDYTYLEENYQYRGYWRTPDDFIRIDLNPNIYHTYNDPNYLPSVVSPSKNLFNKVIYFFMRPTGIYEISTSEDSLYYGSDGLSINGESDKEVKFVEHTRIVPTETFHDESVWDINRDPNITNLNGFSKLVPPILESECDDTIDSTNYIAHDMFCFQLDPSETEYLGNITISANTDHFRLINIYESNYGNGTPGMGSADNFFTNTTTGFTNTLVHHIPSANINPAATPVISTPGNGMITTWNYYWKRKEGGGDVVSSHPGVSSHVHTGEPWYYTLSGGSMTLTPGKIYRVIIIECRDLAKATEPVENFTYTVTLDRDVNINVINYDYVTRTVSTIVDVEEKYVTEEVVEKETITKTISENENCLYHKIDDPMPDNDADIMVGSVYIRQNTSLHSTILTDSRTRGGGILESMPDSLRHELEPESDYYLDIGYYDGKPYQENGVIIVRLDNRLLKEYGGRFTISDIELKVKRWLGVGIYPIIEFVDSYKKEDLPQYTLEIEDNYTNVIDIIPEIFLDCVND